MSIKILNKELTTVKKDIDGLDVVCMIPKKTNQDLIPQIVDYDTGRALGAGEAGEVWLKGPQVMKGYHNNKHATENTMEDGWIKTGEL